MYTVKKPTKRRDPSTSVTSRRQGEMCDLMVMGVSRDTHEDELDLIFNELGDIKEVKLERSQGVAVVTFQDSKG